MDGFDLFGRPLTHILYPLSTERRVFDYNKSVLVCGGKRVGYISIDAKHETD